MINISRPRQGEGNGDPTRSRRTSPRRSCGGRSRAGVAEHFRRLRGTGRGGCRNSNERTPGRARKQIIDDVNFTKTLTANPSAIHNPISTKNP